MTLFEVGIIVAVVMIMLVVLFPQISRFRSRTSSRAPGIQCINNLKQIGLAYRIWEGDNGDILPMGISVTNGGSLEMIATGDVLQTFLVMSNELSTPKILYCPADRSRTWAVNFGGLANSHISYFVSVDVTNSDNPRMVISGDGNFEMGGKLVKSGLNSFGTNDPVTWSPMTRHLKIGNLGLVDGSVQQTTTPRLKQLLQQTSFATNRFAIP